MEAFSPLAQGLLTDRYLKEIPEDSRIKKDGRFIKEDALSEERLKQIKSLNALAAERGQTLAEITLDICQVLFYSNYTNKERS